MLQAYKPAGYFVKGDSADGGTVTGETRRCNHCTYVWEYKPGSGTKRALCLHCMGLMCMRASCAAEQRQLMARFPDRTWNCMPFNDWQERMREQYEKDSRYRVLPSGVVVSADIDLSTIGR